MQAIISERERSEANRRRWAQKRKTQLGLIDDERGCVHIPSPLSLN